MTLDRLIDHPLDVVLVGDVGADAAFGRVEVGDHDLGTVRRETVGDRAADPLRTAGDERDLAIEAGHRIGENEVGIRIRFCWVWISGWILARNPFQVSSAWSSPRRRSRSA